MKLQYQYNKKTSMRFMTILWKFHSSGYSSTKHYNFEYMWCICIYVLFHTVTTHSTVKYFKSHPVCLQFFVVLNFLAVNLEICFFTYLSLCSELFLRLNKKKNLHFKKTFTIFSIVFACRFWCTCIYACGNYFAK